MLYATTPGIAMIRPAAVVMRASEMPPATAPGSRPAASAMTLKELIMPVTVPHMPISGETDAISTMSPSRFSRPFSDFGA